MYLPNMRALMCESHAVQVLSFNEMQGEMALAPVRMPIVNLVSGQSKGILVM
jgi:hypothetical protein